MIERGDAYVATHEDGANAAEFDTRGDGANPLRQVAHRVTEVVPVVGHEDEGLYYLITEDGDSIAGYPTALLSRVREYESAMLAQEAKEMTNG